MGSQLQIAGTRACWFVGAAWNGRDDQTPRFLQEGVWENGYTDKHLDLVRSIRPGDPIAIKSAFTKKRGLPFENRGNVVSVMAIKATGTVLENLGDGRTLKVDWTPVNPPREWYFFTHRGTVWKVLPGNWREDALISFAFEATPQDLGRFRQHPYWRERFGDVTDDRARFAWTGFYEAVANKLLEYRKKRDELVSGIHAIAAQVGSMSILRDQYEDGSSGPLRDICPFTTMSIFNRGLTDENRKVIAAKLADFLGVEEPAPDAFDGIPLVNNQRSWFFSYAKWRQPDDIDALWEVFEKAILFADSQENETEARSAFSAAYDNAAGRYGVGWNLTMGIYWVRPWCYPTLEGQSQNYIGKKLGLHIGRNGPKNRCNADDYLTVLDTLEARFGEEAFPVHSFPELSLAAWLFKDGGAATEKKRAVAELQDDEELTQEGTFPEPPTDPYTVDSILADGCFIARPALVTALERLQTKKNVILQGPPGTGKTWLARRLAFALMGQRDDGALKAVQFHPNLSYEDFVRGWRPAGEGRLSLVDGPFLDMVRLAIGEPRRKYVLVIEEINRGNPAQIFGEMLTLVEADKRTPSDALELSYRDPNGGRVYVPDNLYLIGTMNIADRSLALVDLALRRRFAFIDLEPRLGTAWRTWVGDRFNIDNEVLTQVESRITALNEEIGSDASLGQQFRVGHSYVTPPLNAAIKNPREWFRQVVETEIGPLLHEYWFDAPDRARRAKERLLEGF